MSYDDRVATFQFWPNQLKPNKYQLARNGFYYTGEYDKVTCFCCDMTVYAWEQKDDSFQEHLRLSPSCVFLKMIGSSQGDVQSNTQGRQYGTFETKSHQSGFGTFTPSNACLKQTTSSSTGFGFGAFTPSNVSVNQTPSSSTGFVFGTSTPSNVCVNQTPSSSTGFGFGASTPSNVFVNRTPFSSTGFTFGTSTPSNLFAKQTSSVGGFGII